MPSFSLSKPVDLSDPAHLAPVLHLGGAVNDREFLGANAGDVICYGIKTFPDVVPIPDTGQPPQLPVRPYNPRGTLAVYFHVGDEWKKRFIPGLPINFSEFVKPYDGWTLKQL
jgi:hypothetical protein